MKNTVNGANRFVSRLAAEKKKTVTAACLIALMVFMWVRVLGRKTPVTAAASQRKENVDQDVLGSNMELKISFIELPKIPGRNDVLTRDFFAVDGWRNFIRNEKNPDNKEVIVKGGIEEIVKRAAKLLNLEAIVIGSDGKLQAFINGKLLSVGDKLIVRDGADKYEYEVVGIEENVVFMKYGEAEITLILTKEIEMAG
ncbi:MAG: sortase family protein [Planctomycetota bacterium]